MGLWTPECTSLISFSFLKHVCEEIVAHLRSAFKMVLKIWECIAHLRDVLTVPTQYAQVWAQAHRHTQAYPTTYSSKPLSCLSPPMALKLSCLFYKSWTYSIYSGSLLQEVILHQNCKGNNCFLETKTINYSPRSSQEDGAGSPNSTRYQMLTISIC